MVEGAGGKVEEHTIHSVVGEGERTRLRKVWLLVIGRLGEVGSFYHEKWWSWWSRLKGVSW